MLERVRQQSIHLAPLPDSRSGIMCRRRFLSGDVCLTQLQRKPGVMPRFRIRLPVISAYLHMQDEAAQAKGSMCFLHSFTAWFPSSTSVQRRLFQTRSSKEITSREKRMCLKKGSPALLLMLGKLIDCASKREGQESQFLITSSANSLRITRVGVSLSVSLCVCQNESR